MTGLTLFDLFLGEVFFLFGQVIFRLVVDDRFELGRKGWARAGAGDGHLGAFILAFGHDCDVHAVTLFDLDQIGALFIEQVDRRFGAGGKPDQRTLAACRFVFDQTQRR